MRQLCRRSIVGRGRAVRGLLAEMLRQQLLGFFGQEHKGSPTIGRILLQSQYPFFFEFAHVAQNRRLRAMNEVAKTRYRDGSRVKLGTAKMQQHFPNRMPQHLLAENFCPPIPLGNFLAQLIFELQGEARRKRRGEDLVHNIPSDFKLAQPSAATIK